MFRQLYRRRSGGGQCSRQDVGNLCDGMECDANANCNSNNCVEGICKEEKVSTSQMLLSVLGSLLCCCVCIALCVFLMRRLRKKRLEQHGVEPQANVQAPARRGFGGLNIFGGSNRPINQ